MKRINAKGVEVIIYEPDFSLAAHFNSCWVNEFAQFKQLSDVIVTNRISPDLMDVINKVYNRDLFGND